MLKGVSNMLKRNTEAEYINFLKGLRDEIDEELERLGDRPVLTIPEAVDFFIDECCILDPNIWENYNTLFDEFELFKAEEGINIKILKRTFFAELARRGHIRHPGPPLYEGEPPNSINGIYLRRRRSDVEAARAAPRQGLTLEEYQAGRERQRQEEEEEIFNRILEQSEKDPGNDSDKKRGGGFFDF